MRLISSSFERDGVIHDRHGLARPVADGPVTLSANISPHLEWGDVPEEIFFGIPNDRFAAGDWGIIDGKDTPAVFRPSNTTFYFRHTLTQGVADSQF